jgi:hypothetical protein
VTHTRKTGIAIGILVLSAFVFYGVGQAVIMAAPQIGLILIVLNSMVVTSLGYLFVVLLENSDPVVSKLYLGTRILEAVFLAFGGILLYSSAVVPDGALAAAVPTINNGAYQMGMFSLGIGSTLLFWSMLAKKLLPKWLGVWGIVGYVLLSAGSVLDLWGSTMSMYVIVPGGVFEVVFAFWMILKGVDPEQTGAGFLMLRPGLQPSWRR